MKTNFSRTFILATALAATSLAGGAAYAGKHKMANPSVGGAAMYPAKTIVENASAAPNLKTSKQQALSKRCQAPGHSRSSHPPTPPLPNCPQAPWKRW
jgi:hypothetical protein